MVVSETVVSTETYFAVFTDLDIFLFSSSRTQLILQDTLGYLFQLEQAIRK
jgi:hypothetical protein